MSNVDPEQFESKQEAYEAGRRDALKGEELTLEALSGMSQAEINARWDEVSKLLERQGAK
jgi:hypothetical protein